MTKTNGPYDPNSVWLLERDVRRNEQELEGELHRTKQALTRTIAVVWLLVFVNAMFLIAAAIA